jgi:hypothetical protein
MSMPLRFAAILGAILLGRGALAHHGFYGQYALDETVDFAGTVVAVEWLNPHAFVLVRAEIDGMESVVRVELKGLRQLSQKGWMGDELAIGAQVRVVNAAFDLADGTRACCARIYDSNGKEFYTEPRAALDSGLAQ